MATPSKALAWCIVGFVVEGWEARWGGCSARPFIIEKLPKWVHAEVSARGSVYVGEHGAVGFEVEERDGGDVRLVIP